MSTPIDENENHLDEVENESSKSRSDRWIEKVEAYALSIILFTILALILTQVYFRFFTESSIVWSEELSRFLLIWLVFFGAVVALRQGSHIQIDNLLDIVPRSVRMGMLILRNVMMVLFLIMLLIGILPVLEVSSLQKSPGLGLNMKYVYGVFPVSVLLMTLVVLWSSIKKVKGGD